MELNKIKRLQYNRIVDNTTKENELVNTVLVSVINGFDYPNDTPFDKLLVPFQTMQRARDWLAFNNLETYRIKVLAGNYTIQEGENMDHWGIWELEEGVTIDVMLIQDQYLFTGSSPARIVGRGAFTFYFLWSGFYYPLTSFTPRSEVEAKEIRSAYPLLGIGDRGYLGGWIIFRNVGFSCLDANGQNLFQHADLKSQVYKFEGCTFSNYFFDIHNYSEITFIKCTFYGFIDPPQVTIGAGTNAIPKQYAANFIDCDFDLHSNFTGGILLKDTGVRLCVSRCRFTRGTFNKFSIKNDYANTVAISAIGTSPIIGSIALNNVCGASAFQFINPDLLPYLLTI